MAYTSINKPSDYFNTKLYSGNGSTQSITGVGFQPDWIWYKRRDAVNHNRLIDSVRGSDKNLASDLTNAENTESTYVTSFDSDGWSIGSNTDVNVNGSSMVAWTWLAANGTASNTQGSIASTVSANTTSGFSIVSYTGTGANATVGHGLGVAPKMIICKGRSFSSSAHWLTYHEAMGNTSAMKLNLTSAKETTFYYWNDTSPTSSTFSLGASTEANTSSATFIAYCFAEVKGFSKFGSYTGNNSTNGPFIYCGFKPAFVLIKSTNAAQWWTLLDNKRDSYNQSSLGISPNSSNSESTFNTDRGPHYMDFISNGFKIRTDNSGINGTNSFIYMAFAESPFTTSTGIPTTAR